jgi:hypothetical protein
MDALSLSENHTSQKVEHMTSRAALRAITLGDEGLAYITSRLKIGLALSRSVLKEADLTRMHAFTILPEDTSEASVEQFHVGGVADPQQTLDWLSRFVTDVLPPSAQALLMAENAVARRQDPAIGKFQTKFLLHCDEVIHFTDKVYDPSELRLVLSEAESAHALSAVVSFPVIVDEMLSRPPEISREGLEWVARHTQIVIVSAYDAESYVIGCTWPPSRRR